MIKTNWHTHTARCGHAIGTDEQYVQAAIKAGLTTLGFSDHAPYHTPYPGERMNFEELPDYLSSIHSLKEKYKDKIAIYCGLESESFPSQWELMKYYRKTMDYIIVGQHRLELDGYSSYEIHTPKQLDVYVDRIIYALEHGYADILAHPDVCMWSYPSITDSSTIQAVKKIAEAAKYYDVPVELNCGSGVRRGITDYPDSNRYPYPTKEFFKVFAQNKNDIVIGLDIHNPDLFLTDEYLNRALDVVKDLNCNIIYNYDVITRANKRKNEFKDLYK